MITENELIDAGFVKNDPFYSIHIGGPWYLHTFSQRDSTIGLLYGEEDPFNGNQVSIWATFTDIVKLKELIKLMKGEKR